MQPADVATAQCVSITPDDQIFKLSKLCEASPQPLPLPSAVQSHLAAAAEAHSTPQAPHSSTLPTPLSTTRTYPHMRTAAASHAAALSQGHIRSQYAPRLNAAVRNRRRRLVVAASHTSPFKVQLLHPVKVADADTRPLLVFLPGEQAAHLCSCSPHWEAESVMSLMLCGCVVVARRNRWHRASNHPAAARPASSRL